VIVAMAFVRVVKPPVNEIVDMVAMRDSLMPAARTMTVRAAICIVGAAVGVLIADLDNMLVNMPIVGMMQVTIVEVIDVVSMADRGVPAVRAVAVGGGVGHETCLLVL